MAALHVVRELLQALAHWGAQARAVQAQRIQEIALVFGGKDVCRLGDVLREQAAGIQV